MTAMSEFTYRAIDAKLTCLRNFGQSVAWCRSKPRSTKSKNRFDVRFSQSEVR
jgi:hypothetical protein